MMAAKHPSPTLEARILAALRKAGRPLTVAELHGPGMPGLTSRRSSDIEAACHAMLRRGELETGLVTTSRPGLLRATYSLPPRCEP